jgi:hypothetical protein
MSYPGLSRLGGGPAQLAQPAGTTRCPVVTCTLSRLPLRGLSPAQGWTPLSYARAKGKYGATEEAGIYPEVCHPQFTRRAASIGLGRPATVDGLYLPVSGFHHGLCSWQRPDAMIACSRLCPHGAFLARRVVGNPAPSMVCAHRPRYKPCVYPPRHQDVLAYYGAKAVGSGPPALGQRSPRASFDPEAQSFSRERGSYQRVFEHP